MDGTQPLEYPWPEPPEFGRAIEIAQGILWIRLPLPMALDHVNIYALDDGDGWTIVDMPWMTGMGGPLLTRAWGRTKHAGYGGI